MTYEYAVYFKLLLLCGYKDELLRYIDIALVEQNPLSDIVLELFTAGSGDKKMLSVLNKYLQQAVDSDINYNETVFDYIISFLKRKYSVNNTPMKDIANLMYQISKYTGRDSDEPWYTMSVLGTLFDEAESGYIDKEDYQYKFNSFIKDRVCFCDYLSSIKPKESFFKRFMKKMRGKH